MNPFLILNVPLDATDDQVRKAYQTALQSCPPEGDPVRFQAVQEAWSQLRDERSRWKARLLPPPPATDGPMDALIALARLPGQRRPLGLPAFRQWLQACSAPPEKPAASSSAGAQQKSKPKNKRRR